MNIKAISKKVQEYREEYILALNNVADETEYKEKMQSLYLN